ncbi:MAG: dimethylargininase [Chloroflexi bacterium]|nr:MAG: dimethylargininase [Chloroflexota bacterium]
MRIAITREVSPSMGKCELTFLERVEIDIDLARTQHSGYKRALAELGCKVVSLLAEETLPDSVFVEDAAVVLDEVAIITRPGAESRRPETRSVAQALEPYRELVTIEAPGTVDGGDILRIGKKVYVGSSSRSNSSGIAQMAAALAPFGYQVLPVPVHGCLHLKSAVTQVGEETLLINREWVDLDHFAGCRWIEVDLREPDGANALFVGVGILYSASHPRTRERLDALGTRIVSVDVSEMEKAEGAVTCCSLIFESEG